jgi:hypothetical protein
MGKAFRRVSIILIICFLYCLLSFGAGGAVNAGEPMEAREWAGRLEAVAIQSRHAFKDDRRGGEGVRDARADGGGVA